MLSLPKQASEELAELEGRLRGLRQEHRRARDLVAAAKSAVAASESDATVAAAQEAVKAEKAIAAEIDEPQQRQISLLSQAGGARSCPVRPRMHRSDPSKLSRVTHLTSVRWV